MLDERYGDLWSEFSESGAAEQDRERFIQRLWREGFAHAFPPAVFTQDFTDRMVEAGVEVSRLITEMPSRVFGSDLTAWIDFLGVPQEDAPLLRRAAGEEGLWKAATAFVRPDMLLTDRGLQVVEVNVSAPLGGMNTVDPYVKTLRSSAYGRLMESRGMAPTSPHLAETWLRAFRGVADRTTKRTPHVFEGLANPEDVDSGRRFFVDMLRSGGYEVSSGLVTELEVTSSEVTHRGRPVDIVFTMYTWDETRRFLGPDVTHALIEAHARGLVDFVGSPASALFDNKANLELLTAQTFASFMDDRERELVREYVPSTFRLTGASLERAVSERADLICKPSSAYGGKGVELGSEHCDASWRALVEERCAPGSPQQYICQQFVRPAPVTWPGSAPGGEDLCLGPLVLAGRYGGALLRQMPSGRASVINQSLGAAASAVLTGSS